jgi:hypothetical protein
MPLRLRPARIWAVDNRKDQMRVETYTQDPTWPFPYGGWVYTTWLAGFSPWMFCWQISVRRGVVLMVDKSFRFSLKV